MGRGPRLAFVVRQLKGKRKMQVHKYNPTTHKNDIIMVEKDAGYMVYTPNGTSYRLTKEQLLKSGLDRQPEIINFESVNNTRSPAGRFKYAIDDKARAAAYKELEEQVIRACRRRGATVDTSGDEDDQQAA
jgi:hypothetical protein